MNVVVGNGENCTVVEQCDHHDHHRCHRIKIENQDCQRHEEEHAQRFGYAVYGVAVHPLEDSAAFLDSIDGDR
jgi:hypothetical protein